MFNPAPSGGVESYTLSLATEHVSSPGLHVPSSLGRATYFVDTGLFTVRRKKKPKPKLHVGRKSMTRALKPLFTVPPQPVL